MLHLAYKNKIALEQQQHLGDIFIKNYKSIEYQDGVLKE